MQINYFFGSDSRSIPSYEILIKSNKSIYNLDKNEVKVITLNNPSTIRGKIVPNEFETYCIKNSINYEYYDADETYNDMDNALVCSFGSIFPNKFLTNNNIFTDKKQDGKLLLNLHLSLLPDLKGPTPVEYALLYNYKVSGVTLFSINSKIDSGKIFWTQDFVIDENDYATDIYKKAFECFKQFMLDENLYKNTFINRKFQLSDVKDRYKKTYKIEECDLSLNNLSVKHAKQRIKALNYIGPAKYEYSDDYVLKVHSYTDNDDGLELNVNDGIVYAETITPPGKNTMKAADWLRGQK